jgi:hypothetical protein
MWYSLRPGSCVCLPLQGFGSWARVAAHVVRPSKTTLCDCPSEGTFSSNTVCGVPTNGVQSLLCVSGCEFG